MPCGPLIDFPVGGPPKEKPQAFAAGRDPGVADISAVGRDELIRADAVHAPAQLLGAGIVVSA
jgi:hypothetical protein